MVKLSTNNSINANTTTPLPVVDGGTGVNAVTIAPSATKFAGWDANSNLSANNFVEGYTTTATAGGTTTLTVASTNMQFFTGSLAQNCKMPVANTLVTGMQWMIVNLSSGNVTIQSSGSNTITVMAANTVAYVTCILASGTTATSWFSDYEAIVAGVTSITGTTNQVIASAATGAVTLSLPQSIATTSDVTFNSVTWSDTTKGIVGTTTNNSAAAGYVGEVITNNNNATPVALTGNTYTNITSISLTAGDWDVMGSVTYNPASGTTTAYTQTSISTASAAPGISSTTGGARIASTGSGYPAPTTRLSLAGTTTVYLVGLAQFAVSTMTAVGLIYARRSR